MSNPNYEAVIGLEIHAQLQTKSKLFCSCSTEFGSADNENTCPVCIGLPGALPVLNKQAVQLSIKTGLALNCTVNEKSTFARKNYFYPDLPKGYQISQYDQPICENGTVEFFIDGQKKTVTIIRAHIEEDAGKSSHAATDTLVNLNRSSVPLLEIVSAPDMRSASEAAEYARAVRAILQYVEVCDGNLEEGSMRCDCNVSVRKKGDPKLGTRAELKNINSFRFIEKAIEYEIDRQIDLVEAGEKIVQETRLYDSDKNRTFSMRSKEEAQDYRYFPEPDLLPLRVSPVWVEETKKNMPELPLQRLERFQKDFGLPEYDANILTLSKAMAEYYEETANLSKNPKAASNWIMVELLRELNNAKLEIHQTPVSAPALAKMITMIDSGKISGKIAKTVFEEMFKTKKTAEEIVKEKGLVQVSDEAVIHGWIDEVIKNNAGQVEQFRSGKDKLFGFFVGQVMKVSKGQANPDLVNQLLMKKLKGG
ncbi:MAG: Asp-tRNA(Asn)/Glu-tRNA(Gln) amidotransferase subunit GatB [Bdellovibrionales bacterium]